MHGAAERGRTDILQLLMENGPSVANISDNEGCTPLHLAAKEGITETVRFLLDQKVDMNLRDEVT